MATNTKLPVVTTTGNRVGDKLTASPGEWAVPSGKNATYEYQWLRCNSVGGGCEEIEGAKSSSYTLTAADVGYTQKVRVSAIEHDNVPVPPPPPPGGTPSVPADTYFNTKYTEKGKFTIPPWRSLLSYDGSGAGANGSWNLSILGDTVQTVQGSVAIVNDPAGSGKKVARMRIRDSDPGWPPVTSLQKAEAQSTVEWTWNRASGAQYGDVRWFVHSLYLPYTASERYEWAHNGSNNFTDHLDLHPGNSTAWPAFSFQHYPTSGDANTWFKIRAAGGPTINSSQYLTEYNLFQLTDGSGARVMANHNRWINLVWGMKFNPDNTGWLEVWVDGVNVVPRVSRPTMWAGDYGMYLKNGLYKRKDSNFPQTGQSVIYHGDMLISLSRPF